MTVGDAAWRRESRALLSLAAPLILTQLAQIAISTTDTIMLGWLGPRALAAGALGVNFYVPLFLFGLGLAMAVSPLAAQALGAGRADSVRHIVHQGFWATGLLGLLFSVVIWHGRPVLLALGQAEANASLAESYLRGAAWGLVPGLWVVVLRAFAMARERPQTVLAVMLCGVAINAIADYLLMFGKLGLPALGVAGAGYATSLVNGLMCLSLLLVVRRGTDFARFRILEGIWRPDWPRFLEILRIGLPMGLSILAEIALFAAAAFMMGLFGTETLAAHAIAMQCALVAFMVPLGLGHATTVRVGRAAGAGDGGGVGRSGWIAMQIGLVMTGGLALVFLLAPDLLVSIFLERRTSEQFAVAAAAVVFLRLAAIFQVFDGIQIIAVGALRGLKDTRATMFIALFGYWPVGFGSGAALGFGLGLGGEGVWVGMIVGLLVVALLTSWRFRHRERFIPGLAAGSGRA